MQLFSGSKNKKRTIIFEQFVTRKDDNDWIHMGY